MLRRVLASCVLLVFLFLSAFCQADELGQHIFDAIEAGKAPSDASLLLLTRDLKWYEKNMEKLPEAIRTRVEVLRVEMASTAAKTAAVRMGEPEAIFGATGSWNPGRDMDMVYFGKRIQEARAQVRTAFEEATAELIATRGAGDEILAAAAGIGVPRSLSTGTMSLVVSDVPDFGYKALEQAYWDVRNALAKGESPEKAAKMLHDQIWEALGKNFEAHIASTAPDMYRGAAGQQWWSTVYLKDPKKMRTFAFDPQEKVWKLMDGGLAAVPAEIADRLGFGAFRGYGPLIFSKMASDFAMFFKHEKEGLAGTAKYVYRLSQDLDASIIARSLNKDNLREFLVASAIARDPSKLERLLAETGLTEESIRKTLGELLFQWTEKQLVADTDTLVKEIASHLLSERPANPDEIIKDLVAKARLKFDLNDMANGLDVLANVPADAQKRLLATLETQFGGSDAGEIVIKYIRQQMRLLGDGGGEITLRILKILVDGRRIDDESYKRAVALFEKEGKVADDVADSVRRARKEIMLISSSGLFDVVDDPQALDRLMETWRNYYAAAVIQSPSPELARFRREFRQLPEPELRRIGWDGDELRIVTEVRPKLPPGGTRAVAQLESRLGAQLAKSGLSVRQFQTKLHEILFNPAYTRIGGESADVGGLDVFIGVATGLYSTYDILFNQSLTPEQENLALGNAWVTALPVVGDFAQALITGGEAWYEGDKGKALEAGLWVSIGIMGCVPGGQLPAVIASIGLAAKPIAAGVYDARQAQNLIRAWVESGDWDTSAKPRKLRGLFDRKGGRHALTYEDLLTEKGDVPYKSTMTDGLLGAGATINDSVRDYAEKYVMPQYKAIADLRAALKSVYPDFNDKEWKDEFTARYKIEARGGKGGLALFNAYALVRTKAFQHTIVQLKTWAEDELRAVTDYDAEVQRLRKELEALQTELKCHVLVAHAEASAEAYSRVAKNWWEQESLPLSKLRIYEHYLKTYGAIAGKLRRVGDLFRECSSPYVPADWHLTGFPELDAGRVEKMLASMENGRKGVIEHIEKLLKGFDQVSTTFDPGNECHRKAFDVLAPLRYKFAFTENLAVYYKQLAGSESAWASSYDSAVRRYEQQRDALSKSGIPSVQDMAHSTAFTDALMTFVAAVPYALASGEAELYRTTAGDYEARLPAAKKEYEMAGWATGAGGKALESCLLAGLKIGLTLSDGAPEEGGAITARAQLLGGVPPKENYWHWKVEGGLEPSSRAGQEISLKVAAHGVVTVELLDHFDTALAKVLASASATVTPRQKGEDGKKDGEDKGPEGNGTDEAPPQAWKFSGTSTSNWTVVSGEKGLVLERKPAKMKGPCGWDSTVTAKVWANYPARASGQGIPKTSAECMAAADKAFKTRRQGATPNDMSVGLFMAGGVEGANAFSMGDFQGAMADFALWMRRGSGSPWSGYTGAYFGSNGHGSAVKDGYVVDFGYSVDGGGCWDNSDRAYLVSQGAAAQQEARAILASLRPGKDGEIKQKPYDGPEYDGSDLPKVTLSPPELPKLKIGDTVTVAAEVHNAKPEDSPYAYTWGGTFAGTPEDSKAKASVTIRPDRPGQYELTVGVDGARYGLGWASLKYEVSDVRVAVERVPADAGPVPVGAPTGFTAKLTVDGQPAKGNFVYRWQPHPEAKFDKLDAAAPDVKAVFSKPGRVGVWVQVLEKRGDSLSTVVESAQVEVEVMSPKLELAFEPKDPLVGQDVRARLSVTPDMKDIDLRWMPLPFNARQGSQSRDGRELEFSLKDDKPVEVKVLARAPGSGAGLGLAQGSVTAKKYAVGVQGPKIIGPAPKIWKEGVGLVDAGQAIAVDQIVEFAADVQPAAASGPVTYQWKVASGPCRVSNPTSREARVTAGEAGTCELSVSVRDRNGVELGTGAGGFAATVSREAVKKGQQKAKDVQDAKAKVQAAKDKAAKGDYDGAIRDAADAARLDPANPEAGGLEQKLRREKGGLDERVARAKALMDENRFADAQKEILAATNVNSRYAPILQVNDVLVTAWRRYDQQVQAKLYEVREANKARDFAGALRTAQAWRGSTRLDPYADGELKALEDWARKEQERKDRQTAQLKAGEDKFKRHDYAGSVKDFEAGLANAGNVFNNSDAAYTTALELKGQAQDRLKRLGELVPMVRAAAEGQANSVPVEDAVRAADEALGLQPDNADLKKWRESLVARAGQAKAENDRAAAGRKLLEEARGAENTYLSQLSNSGMKGQWGENLELAMQENLGKAIDLYGRSLGFIPDKNVEKKIGELKGALESRRQFLEQYRRSVALRTEGDALAQAAPREQDFEKSLPMYDGAVAKYRESLALYRPSNAESLERQMSNLEYMKHDRMVRKHWADGQALEKAGRLEDALAAYDRAIASFHPTVPESDRLWIITHAQELRNRMASAPAAQPPAGKAGQVPPPPGGDQAAQAASGAAVAASGAPADWKPVSLGNVSFAVPQSWQYATREQPDVELLHLYWDGDFESPRHGVSLGIAPDYAQARSEMTGGVPARVGGVEVFRAEDGLGVNFLFPPMPGNRAVAMVLFRGDNGSQAVIDAVVRTISVGPAADAGSAAGVKAPPAAEAGGVRTVRVPVGSLGGAWDALAAVGGDFERFARFDGSGLAVAVPEGNSWGKTGLMAKEPMFTIGRNPTRVTVGFDPGRTIGVCVAFAATRMADVALADNAWTSWVRSESGTDFWVGNVQDAWYGRSPGVGGKAGAIPSTLAFTLAPGAFTMTPAGGATQSVAISWLQEGVAVYPYVFSCPNEAGKPSGFALTAFEIASETLAAGSGVRP